MTRKETIGNALDKVPPEWWDDFCCLVECKDVSPEFLAYFEGHEDCQ